VRPSFDILVVDDNASNLLAIEAALSGLGLNLVSAQSGADALRWLLERDFALILLDIEMPSMDGYETARLIRGRLRTRHVPIIFVTAFSREDREILEGYGLGAVDFLFKPIVPEILRAKASVFVELRRRADEVARQAELLRDAERQDHTRRLAEERQRWEAESLREQMEKERRNAAAMGQKATELARTVARLEQAEADLKRYSLELEEADRRKDEFLALLGHELRNPLAPIVTSLELLRSRQGLDPIAQRACGTLDRQVAHLTRLVDDLLDVSRITSGKIELRRQRFPLCEIIDRAVVLCQPQFDQRRQALEVEIADREIPLELDITRMVQVVSNLLLNAAKYSETGSRVRLAAGRNRGEAFISVTDEGRGIDPDMLPRIFGSFVQVNTGGGGLGVGLTLARRLVEMHGGSIHARSGGVGRGSEFEVRIPIAQGVQDAPVPVVAALEKSAPFSLEPTSLDERMRIVVIDDNDDIRETMQQLLQSLGHDVEVAPDGLSGVALVLKERPQVALVDIGMPGLDGYQVAQKLRAELGPQQLRLVAMTGFGQSTDRDRALAAGFDSHLIKPARTDQIRRALKGDRHG
jgi:signal transduction histidine kinase